MTSMPLLKNILITSIISVTRTSVNLKLSKVRFLEICLFDRNNRESLNSAVVD